MKGLRLAPKLTLPLEVAGEAIGILAKRGAGKTNTAVVIVEEVHAAGVQVVVLDPVGVWYGLRAGADGEPAGGLDFVVLGGPHGDLPLEQHVGAFVADAVVDSGQSFVLDVSDFSKTSQRRFVAEFVQRLYSRKGREKTSLLLVLEEADEFAPQRVSNADAPMVGALSLAVKRGRSRGLGVLFITQRSASLNKDVLDQADVLIVMRTLGPRDVEAIRGWIKHQDADGMEDLLPSLASLQTGEAWVWNPEREILARTQIRSRRTFDSSQTPKAGQVRAEPRQIRPVDLDALGKQMAATVERAKENDPGELRRRIRELELKRTDTSPESAERIRQLERELEEALGHVAELEARPAEPIEVRVPVFDGEVDELARLVSELTAAADFIRFHASTVTAALEAAQTIQEAQHGRTHPAASAAAGPRRPTRDPAPARSAEPAPTTGDRPARRSGGEDLGAGLKKGARRMLEVLAAFDPRPLTRDQLSTLAQVTKGGTFSSYLSNLRAAGLIDEQGMSVTATQAGRDLIGHVPPVQGPEQIIAMYQGKLKSGARRMLDILYAAYPNQLSRDDLSEQADVTKGGTFSSYLSNLRSNGLIDESGGLVRLSETLFIGAGG